MTHLSTRAYKHLVKTVRQAGGPCCLCGQPIDYSLPQTDRLAFTTAHIQPQSLFPHLAMEPSNIRGPAHRACNSAEGNRPGGQLADTGGASADW